jgi:hypothetical protein
MKTRVQRPETSSLHVLAINDPILLSKIQSGELIKNIQPLAKVSDVSRLRGEMRSKFWVDFIRDRIDEFIRRATLEKSALERVTMDNYRYNGIDGARYYPKGQYLFIEYDNLCEKIYAYQYLKYRLTDCEVKIVGENQLIRLSINKEDQK